MKLSEFILQPRGPYLFDHYLHSEEIPSPLGSFALEFQVNDASKRPPDDKMLEAIAILREAFQNDLQALTELVHQQYQAVAQDEYWREAVDLPLGLSSTEIAPLLTAKAISVSQNEIDEGDPNPGRIYMSPLWDEEHGLYFARIDDRWMKVDC